MSDSINNFFEKVRYCEVGKLEMYNFLEEVTSGFNLQKLKLIETDFDVYFGSSKEEYESNFTEEQIKKAILEYKKKDKPLPFITFRKTLVTISNSPEKVLDLEKLLFPFEFLCCYQFRGLIEHFVSKSNNISPNQVRTYQTSLNSFKDLFHVQEWEKYITVLQNTTPPLINDRWEFIGSVRKHKGVICSWITHLQREHVIKQATRQQLVAILNKQIPGLDLGKDGRSFNDVSILFEHSFKTQLINLTK